MGENIEFPRNSSSTKKVLIGGGIYQLLMVVGYFFMFASYFHQQRLTGGDYSYFLPLLLDGQFWFQKNGLFSIPWFTPSFCGGIPAFPNPQGLYFSVPQFLSFVVEPVLAVQITAVLFAWLGGIGCYWLLRKRFQIQAAGACLAATAFFWNGFYFHHMVVGHLSFHGFMLTPWLVYALLPPQNHAQTFRELGWWVRMTAAGAILAYMFFSGMVNLIPPVLLTVFIVGVLFCWRHRVFSSFLMGFGCAGVLALSLAAVKLVASLSYLSLFPRSDYYLPGTQGFFKGFLLIFHLMFFGVVDSLRDWITHTQWVMSPHEFELSISLVPLVLFALWAFTRLWRSLQKDDESKTAEQNPESIAVGWDVRQWGLLFLLIGLLSLPWILNVYQKDWNAFLKTLPFVRNSSTLFRWYAVYMLPILVLMGLCWRSIPWLQEKKIALVLFILGSGGIFLQHLTYDRTYYSTRHALYFPAGQVSLFYEAQKQGQIKAHIKMIAPQLRVEFKGQTLWLSKNMPFVLGASASRCFEPIFGYRGEHFPRGSLKDGSVYLQKKGVFNLKNPACLLYPKENGCRVGEHFRSSEREKLEAFVSYRPFPFQIPPKQKWAGILSFSCWLGCLLVWVIALVWSLIGPVRIEESSVL